MVTLIDNTISKPVPVPPKHKSLLSEVRVNGVTIPEHEILLEAQNHRSDNPGEALQLAARALVVRELLVQRAKEMGIEPTPVTSPNGSIETTEDALVRQLIASELCSTETTDEECRRYYENNKNKFCSEPIIEARHILFASAHQGDAEHDESYQVAARLCSELVRSPEKFDVLAQEYSDCPSAGNQGKLGQVTKSGIVSEFWTAALSMNPGSISPKPVKSRYGYHIIAVDRKIDGQQLPFEIVRVRLSAWLEARNWSTAVERFISTLVSESKIEGIQFDVKEGPYTQ